MDIPKKLVLSHLNIDVADEDEVEYIMEQCVPAAIDMAEAFLGVSLYDSQDAIDAVSVAGASREYPFVANRAIKQAILLSIGHFYKNREAVLDSQSTQMPLGVLHLLWPYRRGLGV